MPRKTILRGYWTCFLWALMVQSSFAQNNAIFTGGTADGFTLSCFLQASGNLIFEGGIADGFDQGSFLQASNNGLFAGGLSDGFSQICFLQPSQNAIFSGAFGDGFDEECFAQINANSVFGGGRADGASLACFAMSASNNIFDGGLADGFDEASFFQPSSSLIFAGGIGDGFDFSQSLHSPVFAVELLSFDGIYDAGDSWLTWITETEINNSHFELERSADRYLFEQVATVPGGGTTTEPQIYEYRDPVAYLSEQLDRLYYRLRQVDFDGQFEYSNIVEIKLEPVPNTARVFPNPVSETMFLQVQGSGSSTVSTTLFDLHGREIRQSTFFPTSNVSLFEVELGDLPEGTYYFRVQFGEQIDNINSFKITILR